MDMRPGLEDRVSDHSSDTANRQIFRRIVQSLEYYADHPELIHRRIAELEKEWDIERMLETNASTLILASLALGLTVNKKWFILTGAVAGFLFQHAVQGWCPPLPVMRKLGVRTKKEILLEKTALRALRGDFNDMPVNISDRDRLHHVKRLYLKEVR